MVLLTIRNPWARILDLFFPPRCVGCSHLGAWLCKACLGRIPRIPSPPAFRSKDAAERISTESDSRGWTSPLQTDRIESAAYFEGTLREAIHKFKYDGIVDLAEPLGSLLIEYWSAHPMQIDVVVPVPLHEDRLRERGFNQAQLLAHELSEYAGLPLDTETLIRHRATASQIGLDAAKRKENVHAAFRCRSSNLIDRRVLLIDDVRTTGSTLEACASAVKKGGARSVQALTLARAR